MTINEENRNNGQRIKRRKMMKERKGNERGANRRENKKELRAGGRSRKAKRERRKKSCVFHTCKNYCLQNCHTTDAVLIPMAVFERVKPV
jgi:hypothetical protein